MIKVGDTAFIKKIFSDSDVRAFADISGDNNPIHLDDDYAAGTRFKRRIVHGILTSGLISALFGMHLPGPGSIYLSQTINFRAPVYIGEEITALVTVTKIRDDKPIITFLTQCLNQDVNIVLDGEAVLLAPGVSKS